MSGNFQFAIENLYTFELTNKPGEHAQVRLTKLLTPLDGAVAGAQLGTQMNVFTPSKKLIFSGMVERVEIHDNESDRVLEVEGVSNTMMLDMSLKSRAFQDIAATYEKVLATVEGELANDSAISQAPGVLKAPSHLLTVPDKPLAELLMQYLETDWSFIKRVATHFEQLVYPDILGPCCKYTVGIPTGKDLVIPHFEKHDIHESYDLLQHQLPETYQDPEKFSQLRASFRLVFESNSPVSIGDRLTIKNQPLLVREYRSFLDGDVLSHEICCVKKESFYTPKKGNQTLCGHSLRAIVHEIEHDTVSVQFVGIEKEKPPVMHPFVYATPYSAGKSTGFYFMPEKEDMVFIKFPTEREEDAFADGSIRVEQQGKEAQTGDPKVKYIRTAADKEIAFSETFIKISMKDKDGNDMHILIDEENGIEIKTDKPISITSEKEISLSAKSNIELKADEIKLSGKSCSATLSSTMELKGDIKMG